MIGLIFFLNVLALALGAYFISGAYDRIHQLEDDLEEQQRLISKMLGVEFNP